MTLTRFVAFLAAAAAAIAQTPPVLRLGDSVAPVRQSVDLTVVPDREGFSGSTEIELDVKRPGTVIWLHAGGLTIESAALRSASGNAQAKPLTGNADFLGLQFEQAVPAGRGTLRIAFTGKQNGSSSSGLFRNKMGDDWYSFTQFESIDARRAFPCFDEPSFKIPWQVTLHVKREHMALSNTPAVSEQNEDGGMKVVRFAGTRPLPSYLVAFAAGPFEAVDAGTVGAKKIPLRIITPKGKAAHAKYAAEVTPQILTVLENYFGMPYPYPKLDGIAVPLFFGAMENPGLITYGDTIILADPATDTLNRQRGYASVAAHEMSHQWFGDLVTTAWWNDIWLNEAFATWLTPKILATWKPEWHEEISNAGEHQRAMVADSKLSARQIRQPITSKDDIANAFDGITYEKGSAVIHMFEQWLGPEVFRKGVQEYEKKYADQTATAEQFLGALGDAAGRDISPVFLRFLEQPGLPMLSAELKCDGAQPSVALEQKRFLPLGSKPPAPQTWPIPVCLRYPGSEPSECTLVSEQKTTLALRAAKSCPDWVLLNAEGAGYYRTLYRGKLLGAVLADGGKQLSPVERVSVLGDVEALVRSGDLSSTEALKIVPGFANDPVRQVTATAINVVSSAWYFSLVEPEMRPNFHRFVRKVFGPRAHALGWQSKPGEEDDVRLLRPGLIALVANLGGDQELISKAGELARKWLDDRSAIQPDMAGVTLSIAAQHGDKALYDRVYAEFKKVKDRHEHQQLLSALASFRLPELVKANFQLLLKGEVDFREGLGLLLDPIHEPSVSGLPFELVRTNYDALVAKLPHAVDNDYSSFLPFVGGAFCKTTQRDQLADFFRDRSAKAVGGQRMLAQTLESIDQCIAISGAQRAGVTEFLKAY